MNVQCKRNGFHINQTDGQRFKKIRLNPDPGLKEGFLTFGTLKGILDRIRTNFLIFILEFSGDAPSVKKTRSHRPGIIKPIGYGRSGHVGLMLGMKTQEIDITAKLIILILMFDEGIRNNIGKGQHRPSQGFGNSEEIGKHRLALAFPVLIADGFFVPCFGGVIRISTS